MTGSKQPITLFDIDNGENDILHLPYSRSTQESALPMTMAPSITKGANDQEDDSDFAASPSPSGAASPHGPPSNSTAPPSHPVNWAHHLTLHHQLYTSMEK